jgi:tetratricopeptide (TPR) repeat protein
MHYNKDSRLDAKDIEVVIRGLENSRPLTSYVHFRIASLYEILEDGEKRNKSYLLAAAALSMNADEIIYRGLAQWRLGFVNEALASFSEAVVKSSTEYQRGAAYANRSSVFHALGQLAQACLDLKMAVQLKNPYSTRYFYSDSNTWCKQAPAFTSPVR